MILNCPLPAALTAIVQPACPFRFDQIVRMAFQRRQAAGAEPFPTLVGLQTLANWTALLAAADSTKIVVSPIFSSLVIPSSEALTSGGNDNTTFAGIREYNGEGAVTVTGQFKNLSPASKRSLDLLAQESLAGSTGTTNLTGFFFNKDGYSFQVNPLAAGVATTKYKGFEIYNFRIGTPGSEGLNSPNVLPFSFDLKSDWFDYATSVKPNFDPLTEI
jgi:hypothetical protein